MEQNGTQMKFILDMLQGLPGKSAENASPAVCLFPIFHHLFTNALVFGTGEEKKTTTEEQQSLYRYSAGEKEDQVSLSLCWK